jgi:hypothetical protein
MAVMKNKLLLFFFSLLFSLGSLAQGFSSVSDAVSMARAIVEASGKTANFVITEANVPNAMAVLTDGKRYILYNPGFINRLAAATGTRWAAVSVLAHEIGHHLNRGNHAMATELEADEFSGYILHKMGATLEDAQAAMRLIATEKATGDHPGRDDRLSSIAIGWQNAGRNKSMSDVAIANESVPERTTMRENPSLTRNNNAGDYILADLNFNADPGTDYYLTTQLSVIKIRNNESIMIGRLTSFDNEEYPFVIYDEAANKVYIDRTGNIVNRRGQTIGTLRMHGSYR